MIILLRGHIRDAFASNKLYNLIQKICLTQNNVSIFIHTWDVVQSNVSWRELRDINITVTSSMIENYFRGLNQYIKNITIESDKKIMLIGKKNGLISLSKCPLLGWKNMWYGKKSAIDTIMAVSKTDDVIINMRFDIFSNSNALSEKFILQFIEFNKKKYFHKNIFPFRNEKTGIDNIYIGNINTMFNLIYNFHYNLDDILLRHNVSNQEFLVYRENNQIFNDS